MRRPLLRRFLELYPFQPATAIWRAVEVAEVARVRFPDGRGLDLGCGDGRLTRVITENTRPMRLVGLDVDPQETSLAQAERLYERVHTSSAAVIPEPDASFDFVMSISVMEHIAEIEHTLSEVARVLRPGGLLITTVPSAGFHDCLRGPLLPGVSRSDYLARLDRRVAHLRYWTSDDWRRALDTAGLSLIEVRAFLSRQDVRRWETTARLTAGVLHAVSGRKAPIEIQRSLGMRRAGMRMPRPLAALLSSVLGFGLRSEAPTSEAHGGCVLVIARRP
jgi:SAM-dependent methyltransferase